ncbi:hypothetical protein [Pseudomonas soli]|uniref:hypothetical protein n=1 Tax=Pseudomonas soli TaxID=1306993 RepID=UPI0028A9FC2E|nr:hypothetical protein [Pseudomonas soli]
MNTATVQYLDELLLLPSVYNITSRPEWQSIASDEPLQTDIELISTMQGVTRALATDAYMAATALALRGIIYLTGRITAVCLDVRRNSHEALECDLAISLQLPGEPNSHWADASSTTRRQPVIAAEYAAAVEFFVAQYPSPSKAADGKALILPLAALSQGYDMLLTLLLTPFESLARTDDNEYEQR